MASNEKYHAYREGDTEREVETDAWNIARNFTGRHIALPLGKLNELEDIARFGSLNIDEELPLTDDHIDKRRVDALKRYWQKIRQIIEDTKFKVKRNDKEKGANFLKMLHIIPKYFDGLLNINRDGIDGNDVLKINEEFFIQLLNKLVETKVDYLELLDRAGLIFRESDEINLDMITSEFVNGG